MRAFAFDVFLINMELRIETYKPLKDDKSKQ